MTSYRVALDYVDESFFIPLHDEELPEWEGSHRLRSENVRVELSDEQFREWKKAQDDIIDALNRINAFEDMVRSYA